MELFSPPVSFLWVILTLNMHTQSRIHGCARCLYCQMERAAQTGRTCDRRLIERVHRGEKELRAELEGKKPEEEHKGSLRSSSILESTHLKQLPTVTLLSISSPLTHSALTPIQLLRFPLLSLSLQPPHVLASLSSKSDSLGLLSSNCIFL